jgi:hypothetical protein
MPDGLTRKSRAQNMIAPCYPLTQTFEQKTGDRRDKAARCNKILLAGKTFDTVLLLWVNSTML